MNNKRAKISESQNLKLEIIAILSLVLFALASFFLTNISSASKSNKEIEIYVAGEKITHINGVPVDINVDGTFTIENAGNINVIEIKNKKIRCIESNCPDQICVRHGYLNPDIVNDLIVCAPHKLMILYN